MCHLEKHWTTTEIKVDSVKRVLVKLKILSGSQQFQQYKLTVVHKIFNIYIDLHLLLDHPLVMHTPILHINKLNINDFEMFNVTAVL